LEKAGGGERLGDAGAGLEHERRGEQGGAAERVVDADGRQGGDDEVAVSNLVLSGFCEGERLDVVEAYAPTVQCGQHLGVREQGGDRGADQAVEAAGTPSTPSAPSLRGRVGIEQGDGSNRTDDAGAKGAPAEQGAAVDACRDRHGS
jgi:hypothetical protein